MTIPTLLILALGAAPPPPQTAYDRAMDALRELREENDGLRTRLAAAENGAVESVTIRAGEAVHVAAPDDLLAGDAELQPSPGTSATPARRSTRSAASTRRTCTSGRASTRSSSTAGRSGG